jgi:hypothetical protein
MGNIVDPVPGGGYEQRCASRLLGSDVLPVPDEQAAAEALRALGWVASPRGGGGTMWRCPACASGPLVIPARRARKR